MIRVRPSGGGWRRFFLAAFGADVAPAALAFRAAVHRFLGAAAMRRRAAERAMRMGDSSSATATVLSKPGGPVMRTRTPREGVLGNPVFVRLSVALPGGLRAVASMRSAGGGGSLAVEDDQGHGVRLAGHAVWPGIPIVSDGNVVRPRGLARQMT
jgi:hypothetical protein